MDAAERKALEADGYRVYDHIGDALGMTEDEKELMDIRIILSRAVKKRRENLQLSQKDLANLLGISRSKVAKIEWGDRDIPSQQIFAAYEAMDGPTPATEPGLPDRNGRKNGAKPTKKKLRTTG